MDVILTYFSLAMNEFEDQLDATEKDEAEKLIGELREISVNAQPSDTSAIGTTQGRYHHRRTASLGLSHKVRDSRRINLLPTILLSSLY